MERVDDAHPNRSAATVGVGVNSFPAEANLGLARSRRAEDKPESRTGRTKLSRRCRRKVELKRVRQQEYAVNSRTALKIGDLHRAEFIDERGRPVIENLGDRTWPATPNMRSTSEK